VIFNAFQPIQVALQRLHPRFPFGISRGVRTSVENLFISLSGHLGEAAPVAYLSQTGEVLLSQSKAIRVPDYYIERPEEAIQEIRAVLGDFHPLLAAMDMAIHSAWAAGQGHPLHRIWQIEAKNAPPSSFTIALDTPERMVERLEFSGDYPILKIKLGGQDDVTRLKAIRQATTKTLRVDANEGWDRQTARWWIERLPDWNVDLVEQPLPRGDREGLLELNRINKGRIPIILDESVHISRDIPGILGTCDGINIKLAKCGGLLEARKMIHLAREHGLRIMGGCMLESSVGITAAAHLAPFVDFVDLDGAALLADDPFDGVWFEKGQVRFPDRPGLGVVFRGNPHDIFGE